MTRSPQLYSLLLLIGLLACGTRNACPHEMSAKIENVQTATNGIHLAFTVSGDPDFIDIEGSPTLSGIFREEQNVQIVTNSSGPFRAFIPDLTANRFFRVRLMSQGTNTLIIPIEAQTIFGSSFAPTHVTPLQQVYGATEFKDAPTDVLTIHGLALRLDEPGTHLDTVVEKLTIRMGIYREPLSTLPSFGFASDELRETVVDATNVHLVSVPAQRPPNAYEVRIAFEKPYRYDLTFGQLVLTVGEINAGHTGFGFDAVRPVQQRGVLYRTESVSHPRASSLILATKFYYTAVRGP